MAQEPHKNRWTLPYETLLPADPKRRRLAKIARVTAYVLTAVALLTPVVQFQIATSRNMKRAARFDRKYPNWTPAVADAGGPRRPKEFKGAVGRWRKAVRQLWDGRNIYLSHEQVRAAGPLDPDEPQRPTWLHPNTPFTVILLTPFAYLPGPAMALCFNLLKVLVLVATLFMLASLAGHKDKRICDWVLGLGALVAVSMITGDILHGNTNIFVLGAVVFHLWLYRRGQDFLAGWPLALAICLKMTPAIFLLYWIYQRNGKLLAGAVTALLILAVVIPAIALGPTHHAELMDSWLENLILPGLVKGAWYPVHINQSLPGVFSRYFLEGRNGNIFWNPDDDPYEQQQEFGSIARVTFRPETVKWLIRLCQAGLVVFLAWAIGWRKLPRDDGRRLLHYGLIATAWLLLNQRTWDHHAGVLLIAYVAIWQAIGFGWMPRYLRATALAVMLAAALLLIASHADLADGLARLAGRSEEAAERFADYVEAYGPLFYHMLLVLVVGGMLSVSLRKIEPPYAAERQTLFR